MGSATWQLCKCLVVHVPVGRTMPLGKLLVPFVQRGVWVDCGSVNQMCGASE